MAKENTPKNKQDEKELEEDEMNSGPFAKY